MPKKRVLWLLPLCALISVLGMFWSGRVFTFSQAALLVKVNQFFALKQRLQRTGTQSQVVFNPFDFTVRTAEPVPDGMLVYLTASDAPGMLPQLECLMHLRHAGWLWQLYDYGCGSRGPAAMTTQLHIGGYGPEQRDELVYSYAFGLVNDPKARRVLVLFTDGIQRAVPIQTQAFVAAVPFLRGVVKVESVDKDGHVIASWEAPA